MLLGHLKDGLKSTSINNRRGEEEEGPNNHRVDGVAAAYLVCSSLLSYETDWFATV